MYKFLLFLCLGSFSFSADAKQFVFSTLEWPPYACEACEGQGASISLLKKIFAGEGHTLRVIFHPWSRCLREAQKGHVQACWPAWPADLIGTRLVASQVLFYSHLGVAERVDRPLSISGFADLVGFRLGVVQEYGYSDEYLLLLKNGALKPEVVRTDIQNIEKLGAKRIDGTLIDEMNFRYLLETGASHLKGKVQMNKIILKQNSLVLGMNEKSADELRLIIEQGLKKHKNLQQDVDGELNRLIKMATRN